MFVHLIPLCSYELNLCSVNECCVVILSLGYCFNIRYIPFQFASKYVCHHSASFRDSGYGALVCGHT